MILTCKITGLAILADHINFQQCKVSALHPVFTMPLDELARLASNQTLSDQEAKLLTLALLSHSNLVQYRNSLPLVELSPIITAMALPRLPSLVAYTIANKKQAAVFPVLALDCADTYNTSLINWLDIIADFRKFGAHFTGEAQAVDIETVRSLAKARAQRQTDTNKVQNSIISWAVSRLLIHSQTFTDASIRDFTGAIKGQDTALPVLQHYKGLVLDFLPERNSEEFTCKQYILSRLDAAIVNRLSLLQDLGIESSIADYITATADNYSIVADDGTKILNSANIAAQAIAAVKAKPTTAEPVRTIISSEPKRSDYQNELGYIAAMNRWNQQQKQQ